MARADHGRSITGYYSQVSDSLLRGAGGLGDGRSDMLAAIIRDKSHVAIEMTGRYSRPRLLEISVAQWFYDVAE